MNPGIGNSAANYDELDVLLLSKGALVTDEEWNGNCP